MIKHLLKDIGRDMVMSRYLFVMAGCFFGVLLAIFNTPWYLDILVWCVVYILAGMADKKYNKV